MMDDAGLMHCSSAHCESGYIQFLRPVVPRCIVLLLFNPQALSAGAFHPPVRLRIIAALSVAKVRCSFGSSGSARALANCSSAGSAWPSVA